MSYTFAATDLGTLRRTALPPAAGRTRIDTWSKNWTHHISLEMSSFFFVVFVFQAPGLRFVVQAVAETEAGLAIGEQRVGA